jgi:hypothetical protein
VHTYNPSSQVAEVEELGFQSQSGYMDRTFLKNKNNKMENNKQTKIKYW